MSHRIGGKGRKGEREGGGDVAVCRYTVILANCTIIGGLVKKLVSYI